jgi:hypothetical protein
MTNDSTCTVDKPVKEYWKVQAFNHKLSSERITIKRTSHHKACGEYMQCNLLAFLSMQYKQLIH